MKLYLPEMVANWILTCRVGINCAKLLMFLSENLKWESMMPLQWMYLSNCTFLPKFAHV